MKYISILILSLVMSTVSLSHSWYPPLCCNGTESGGDCMPVRCEDIYELEDGSLLYNNIIFNKDKIHPSIDSKCHACIGNKQHDKDKPYCIFIQMNS